MRVDPARSIYHEVEYVRSEFSRAEIKRLRILLRRLRFLEAQVRATGGISSGNSGGVFAEMEADALEWVLNEVGYLAEKQEVLPT